MSSNKNNKANGKAFRIRKAMREGKRVSDAEKDWLRAYSKSIGPRGRKPNMDLPELPKSDDATTVNTASPEHSPSIAQVDPSKDFSASDAVTFSNEPAPTPMGGNSAPPNGENHQASSAASTPAKKEGPCRTCGSRGADANKCKDCGKDHSVDPGQLEFLFKMVNGMVLKQFRKIEVTPEGNYKICDETLEFSNDEAKACSEALATLANEYNVVLNAKVAAWLGVGAVTIAIIVPKGLGVMTYFKIQKLLKEQQTAEQKLAAEIQARASRNQAPTTTIIEQQVSP